MIRRIFIAIRHARSIAGPLLLTGGLLLNRDTSGEREVVLDWSDIRPSRVLACETLTGPDLKAFDPW